MQNADRLYVYLLMFAASWWLTTGKLAVDRLEANPIYKNSFYKNVSLHCNLFSENVPRMWASSWVLSGTKPWPNPPCTIRDLIGMICFEGNVDWAYLIGMICLEGNADWPYFIWHDLLGRQCWVAIIGQFPGCEFLDKELQVRYISRQRNS